MDSDQALIVTEDVGTVAVDELVNAIATSIPGLNVAWNISKALYGVGLKLRQQRALEWVEMVRDNPSVLTQQVFSDTQFQDAFVYSLERYITVRSSQKRQRFRKLFLSFAEADNKDAFELEKCFSVLDELFDQDIVALRDVDIARNDSNYQVFGHTNNKIENIYNLIHAGVLLQDITPRLASEAGYNAPFVQISPFGRKFINYLKLQENDGTG
jgi:hypothetical protein